MVQSNSSWIMFYQNGLSFAHKQIGVKTPTMVHVINIFSEEVD